MDFSALTISDFKHSIPIQIRFSDCDMAGHVNNATVLTYYETARIEFLFGIVGLDNDWKSTGLILAHSEIDYIEPVYLQDKIKACSRITRIGSKSFTIENILVKTNEKKEVIASFASFVLVCMDYHKKESIEIPQPWKDKMKSAAR
ncbi:MAG: acyl-CoA thioesterase [Bacteroidetes bacterium]|nr:acyl-CoA thioesterase [Bacteroidota bacterium]